MRCATCGHAWYAKLQEEGAPPEPEDTGLTREQVERLRQTAAANSAARAGPHAEFRAREHAKRKRNKTRAVGYAWLAGFAIFASGIGSAILFRNEVAEAFPKIASIYELVGLDVNRFGLVLENVGAKRSFDGTTPVLTVTGSAVNKGDDRREAPKLQVILRDEAGNEVQTWTDSLSVPALGPGERIEFSSRREAPPVETYRLTVQFAHEPGEKPEGGETTISPTSESDGHAAKPGAGQKAGGGAPDGEHEAGYQEPGWNGGDAVAGADEISGEQAHAAPKPEPIKETDNH